MQPVAHRPAPSAASPARRHRSTGQRLLRAALVVLLVVGSLMVVPGVLAQDTDSVDACKQEFRQDPIIEEYACYVAATLQLRSLVGSDTAQIIVYVYGGLVLAALVGWLVVGLGRITPRRMIRLQALDAVQEVPRGTEATYHLELENRRRRRPVDVEVSLTDAPKGWAVSLAIEKPLPSGFRELIADASGDALRFPLSGRKRGANRADIQVIVQTAEDADPEQWSEIDLVVVPYYKDKPRVRKGKEARLVTLVKEPEVDVRIMDVQHEPATIHPGDDVTTTVTLVNEGSAAADDMSLYLDVNDEELGETDLDVAPGATERVAFKWTAPSEAARVKVALRR